MDLINWTGIYEAHFNKGTKKFDEKAAVDWFKKNLNERVSALEEEVAAKAERELNRDKALHAAFDKAGQDKLPKPKVLDFAMQFLKVDLFASDYDAERELLEKIIHGSNEETGCFGTYVSGPNSGLVRCRDLKGKETDFFKKHRDAIQFGVVKRAKKS